MADRRVVVAGVVLRERRLQSVGLDAGLYVYDEHHVLTGAGALAAASAAAGARVEQVQGVAVELVARVGTDDAGTWCLSELIGRGVDVSGVVRDGVTGEQLYLQTSTGRGEHVLIPGAVDTSGIASALQRCSPGDVFVVDGVTASRHPRVVEDAYHQDMQVVLDLAPVLPGVLTAELEQWVDVVVVDPAGAGCLADSATTPSSVAVYGGPHGCWWDELRVPALAGDGRSAVTWDPGVHDFSGALAVGLASGLDRPDALALAAAAGAGWRSR